MENRKLIYNPILPLSEYIPDVEPHVFGDRIYLYGSHDLEGGNTYCMLDYTLYSASICDLSDWKCEGVIYKADQDPDYLHRKYMYAPDVVCGNDGRYYLYYCMSGEHGDGGYHGPISVAVCDSPNGHFEYIGCVKNKDGSPMLDYVCFDPAVMNDNGIIRLYYGTSYPYEEEPGFYDNEDRIKQEMSMFNKSREEILSKDDSVMGACMLILEDDMVTVKAKPKHIIPYKVKGTSFEEHPFFEGSSIRKIGHTYYFIYSSLQNHELCYATSIYPDKGFSFGGTIVSNGDIGYMGRTEDKRLNMTGTTHGSIECINGRWYVFYHRLTHKSDYSRQVCAERINIEKDGSIKQVEITSCGLNSGPLPAAGTYPAAIACNITNAHMVHGSNKIYKQSFPNVTHRDGQRFIGEIGEGTLIGFKYFEFKNVSKIGIRWRDDCNGKNGSFIVKCKMDSEPLACIDLVCESGKEKISRLISADSGWSYTEVSCKFPDGINPLYLIYHGSSAIDLLEISFR